MSEKVLGFREVKRNFQASTTNNEKIWAVFERDLVPVNLKSESVTIEEIEKVIKKRPCKSCEYFTDWLKELKKNQVSKNK